MCIITMWSWELYMGSETASSISLFGGRKLYMASAMMVDGNDLYDSGCSVLQFDLEDQFKQRCG